MRRQGIASLILYAFSHITRLSLACTWNFGSDGGGRRDGIWEGTARHLYWRVDIYVFILSVGYSGRL